MKISDHFGYELYEKTARSYDKDRFTSKTGRWLDCCQKHLIHSLLGDIRGKRILEIGSGTGRITEFLCQLGGKVIALEPAENMNVIARSRFIDNNLQEPEFIIERIEDYNSNGKNYDAIVSTNVFGHLLYPLMFFQKCGELLYPDGSLLFNFPNMRSLYILNGLFVNISGRAIQRRVFSHWYWPCTINKFLTSTGFHVIKKAGHFYLPINNNFNPSIPIMYILNKIFSKPQGGLAPSVFVLAKRK
jgi:2-polyprenyl-3-methyl-5-hydroxy-6-metoxy-1,4-benzoquinol methylase